MKRVLIIVPAYNEEMNILSVISDIQDYSRKAAKYKLDYLVINDCSTDSTLNLLIDNNINYVSLPLNLGIGGGVQTGYKYALDKGYDVAVQLDGDGQHDVGFIDDLIDPVVSGECDLAIGSRFIEKEGFQSSGIRRLGIGWLSILIRLIGGVKVKDVTSGFRSAGKKVIRAFAKDYAQDYPEPESIVLCAKKGFRIREVAVRMRERRGGVSSISPVKSLYYMIKVTLAIVFTGAIYGRVKNE